MDQLKITPEHIFLNRRKFIQRASIFSSVALFSPLALSKFKPEAGLKITKEELATSYNNFYEFSLEKDEVKKKVEAWKVSSPWKIEVSGQVKNKKVYNLEDLIALAGGKTEERVYRFRCVEAWSMVVPWKGFPLADLIRALGSDAKFVKFQTFGDKSIGPNIAKLPNYPWPYTEGLTMEEALHPLTFIATGMYGKDLPKQNGAPLRLVVPWKYGFKSIKSITKIEFTNEQPKTLWNQLAPAEYGFYANVNPQVGHPRWSQASERILDGSFFPKRQPTLMFNGYEIEVASLYKGVDLVKNY